MKKDSINQSFLQIIYLIVFFILLLIIIFTPALITGSTSLTKDFILEEEFVEGGLVMILLILSFLTFNLYKKEVNKHKEQIKEISNNRKLVEEMLKDTFIYIGKINVQIQNIKSIFKQTNKYPETKNDFKKVLYVLGERVFDILNVNWFLFRIINCDNQKTISEHFETRKNSSSKDYPNISNKAIIEKKIDLPFSLVFSDPQNLNIMVCCILPINKISDEENVLIEAIVNQITMLFIIFKSRFYKN